MKQETINIAPGLRLINGNDENSHLQFESRGMCGYIDLSNGNRLNQEAIDAWTKTIGDRLYPSEEV
jgi:hypothetical protein